MRRNFCYILLILLLRHITYCVARTHPSEGDSIATGPDDPLGTIGTIGGTFLTSQLSFVNNPSSYFTTATLLSGGNSSTPSFLYDVTPCPDSGSYVLSTYSNNYSWMNSVLALAPVSPECVVYYIYSRNNGTFLKCINGTAKTENIPDIVTSSTSIDAHEGFVAQLILHRGLGTNLFYTIEEATFTTDNNVHTLTHANLLDEMTFSSSVDEYDIKISASAFAPSTHSIAVVTYLPADTATAAPQHGVFFATMDGIHAVVHSTQTSLRVSPGAHACLPLTRIDARPAPRGRWVARLATVCQVFNQVTTGTLIIVEVEMDSSDPVLGNVVYATPLPGSWTAEGAITYGEEGKLLVVADKSTVYTFLVNDYDSHVSLTRLCKAGLAASLTTRTVSVVADQVVAVGLKYAPVSGLPMGPLFIMNGQTCEVVHGPEDISGIYRDFSKTPYYRNGHHGAINAIGAVGEAGVVTAGTDGSIRLWSTCPGVGKGLAKPVYKMTSSSSSSTSSYTTCTDCDYGYCLGRQLATCPPHTYPDPANHLCRVSAGYYLHPLALEPAPCKPGHACPGGDGEPLVCSPGSYTADESGTPATGSAAVRCELCQPGYICIDNARKPCQLEGLYTAVSSVDATPVSVGASACLPCLPGYACPGYGVAYTCDAGSYVFAHECRVCEQNYYCIGGQRRNCAAGEYVADRNGNYVTQGAVACVACPPGHTCPGDGTVTTCPVGHYCPNYITVRQCSAGNYTVSSSSGAMVEVVQGATACLLCPAGNSCNGSVRVPCTNIGLSYEYQPLAGQAECLTCSDSTYAEHVHIRSPTRCEYCPNAQYRVGGRCTPCNELTGARYCRSAVDAAGARLYVEDACAGDEWKSSSFTCAKCNLDELCIDGRAIWLFRITLDLSTLSGKICAGILAFVIFILLLILYVVWKFISASFVKSRNYSGDGKKPHNDFNTIKRSDIVIHINEFVEL